jgi:molecular chaperone GrpE (heat shock protein)
MQEWEGKTDQSGADAGGGEEELLPRVLERLAAIEAQLAEFNRRASHREAVIDRLHAENQELRSGVRRAILEPAVVDLIRLHDGLCREAGRAADEVTAGLVSSFACDVELILDRCGLELFTAEPGDPYRPGEHRPVAVVATEDHKRDNTIAEVVSPGFRERDGSRVRRPAQVRVHRHQDPPGKDGASTPGPGKRARKTTIPPYPDPPPPGGREVRRKRAR